MTLFRGCLAIVLLVIGFGAGIATVTLVNGRNRQLKTEYRLNGAMPMRPVFLRDRRACSGISPPEHRLDQAMLDVAKAAVPEGSSRHGAIPDGIVSYFAWKWRFRGYNRCEPSADMIGQLAPIIARTPWPEPNTPINDLRLAERLPPSELLARRLARIAFLRSIPPSSMGGEDSRPLSRLLLGDQGAFARPWTEPAIAQINGNTRLGTSAAYLAVATDPDTALPKIRQVMDEKLRLSREHPTQAYTDAAKVPAIRPADANRLIELGYAIARAGAKARPYSQPVVAMLSETLARPMPPFGLSATSPTEFCRIADRIGGRAAQVASNKPFCAAGFARKDGAPRPF